MDAEVVAGVAPVEVDVGTRWTPTGEGLPRSSISHWRRQLAGLVLVNALVLSEAFWQHVEEIRRDASRLTVLAKRYAKGKRRLVIERLLFIAAVCATRAEATDRLYNAGVRAHTVEDDAGVQDRGRPASYVLQDRFLATILDGATFTALRGAGRCLGCREPLPDRRAHRDQCERHEVSPDEQRWLDRTVERLFQYAAPALLG